MYLSYEQVAATSTVKTQSDLTIPENASHAELQADTSDIRYTMDNSTDPTQATGMVLQPEDQPKQFVIDDIRRIKFVRGSGSDGKLNIHYFAGRDV